MTILHKSEAIIVFSLFCGTLFLVESVYGGIKPPLVKALFISLFCLRSGI